MHYAESNTGYIQNNEKMDIRNFPEFFKFLKFAFSIYDERRNTARVPWHFCNL